MNKRIFRSFRENIGRYVGLFLLTVLAIGMMVGYIEGINSSLDKFDNYLEDNCLEDGLIETEKKLSDTMISDIESLGLKLYENYYCDLKAVNDSKLRVFGERKDIDIPCAVEGKLPTSDNEIFLDQIYTREQSLSVGDKITVNGKEYSISGIGCFPDYTISIASQTDMLADRREFGVGCVTASEFSTFAESDICYNYGYKFNNTDLSDDEQKKLAYEVMKTASCAVPINDYNDLADSLDKMKDGNSLKSSTSILNNKRIATVHSKLESNKSMAMFFVGIVLVIVAFIYTIISAHSIQKESKIIGTLRALGYKKHTITAHYVMLPAFITLAAGIVGSILGITYFSSIPVNSMVTYYSLPDMTHVDVKAAPVILAILIPFMLICVINYIYLSKMLSLRPLRLLRNDWSKAGKLKKGGFNFLPFKVRFNLRMFTRNFSMYLVLFVGIFLASWLMIFGVGMSSSFDDYVKSQSDGCRTKYQYMLSEPAEFSDDTAEKLTACEFEIYYEAIQQNMSVTCYGVDKQDTRYFKDIEIPKYGIVVSDVVSNKFGVEKGDELSLRNAVNGLSYKFEVKDICKYDIGMTIFMDKLQLNNLLGKYKDYYNCIFTDKDLELSEDVLSATITSESISKSGEVLKNSMQGMMTMFPILACIIYFVMMYLMIKTIIEKNKTGISMLKIFGFRYNEVKRMYIMLITIVVIVSIIISMPLAYMLMRSMWPSTIKTITGFFEFTMNSKGFVLLFIAGFVSYIVTLALNLRGIRNIPPTLVLKNQDE